MLLGTQVKTREDFIYVIIGRGQSHPHGAGAFGRLANTDFNYQGIAAGYPAVRSGQPQYSGTPIGCYQYVKKMASVTADNWNLDNSSWLAYDAASARVDATQQFGPELSLMQRVQEYTGKEVFLIKSAQSGTALQQESATSAPGCHNFTNYQIVRDFVIRAIRDLKTFRPNKRIVLIADYWWQGEQDAINGLSGSNYVLEMTKYDNNWRKFLGTQFTITNYLKFYFRIRFNNTAAETAINASMDTYVSSVGGYRIDTGAYPRRNTLTVLENAPLGVIGADDNHASYIGNLAGGELMFADLVSSGII